MPVTSRAWLMVPSTPERRAYFFCQVSLFCSVRAAARVSWSSRGRRVRVRRSGRAVVHWLLRGQGVHVVTLYLTTMTSWPCCRAGFQAELVGLPVHGERGLVEALGCAGLWGVVQQD